MDFHSLRTSALPISPTSLNEVLIVIISRLLMAGTKFRLISIELICP